MVVSNLKTRTVERTELELLDCRGIDPSEISDLSLEHLTLRLVNYQKCIMFKEDVLIGWDKKAGIKRYIEINVLPCLTGCYSYTFPTPPLSLAGPQEIKPTNPLGAYEPFMHQLAYTYNFVALYINAASDYQNYDTPITRTVGIADEFVINMNKEIIGKITFDHLIVKTYDGLLKRTVREDRKMKYKNTSYRAKSRVPASPTRYLKLEIELSDDMTLVERVYPNLIDLLSEIGGLVSVLIIICVFTGTFHNQVLFEKYLLNAIILADDFQNPDTTRSAPNQNASKKPNFQQFSYFDIVLLNYGCKGKKSEIKKTYDRKMEIVKERMDLGNIVIRSEIVTNLAEAVFEDYHLRVL